MDKAKLILEAVQRLMKVAEDIRSLADSVQALCTLVTDSLQGKEPESQQEEPEKASEIPLEKVRGVLAEKSRAGHTAEVRAIIQKYGADKLSGIDPKDYPAVLAEAEVL